MSTELLELGSKPIAADAPTGISARDEPEFAELQLEVRKLELPDQPVVKWDVAVDQASRLLSSKSKDVLVGAYLALALFERDGHPGLATGLTVMRDMLANFWETLWPEARRLRGRVAAFEWLSERGAAAVRRRGDSVAKPEAVKLSLERIEQIGELLSPHVEGGAYLLTDLRDALQEIPTEESPPSPPAASTSSSAPAAIASASVSAVPATLNTSDDYEQALTEAKRLMRQAADWLRTNEPFNPLSYRMSRFATWLTTRMPPAVDGKTQIPPPQPADLLDKLGGMMANGQYAGVLETTEGRFPNAVFWLDLHRFAAQALERMGPDAKAASDAVNDEVAALVARLPGVADLRFANDQPVATTETKQWIARLAASGDGGGTAMQASTNGTGEEAEVYEKVRAEARGLAQQKKLPEALRMLEQEAARAGNLRDRVRWKLESARLCMENAQQETALAHLEGVDQVMRDADVESWDPVLCVEVLRLLLGARQRVLGANRTPDEAARSRELLGRLCRLDLVAALELNGKR